MPFNANGYVEAYMVNGQSMDTSQFAIETVQESLPVMRGDNVVPAMDHGVRWRSKRLGPRSENWSLWICDAETSSGLPPSTEEGKRAQFHANWDTVMGILFTTHLATGYDAPLQVVRKMKQDTSTPSNASYMLNYGEVLGNISVDDYRPWAWARFTVNVGYMDPRWYECNSTGTKTDTVINAGTTNAGGTALMTKMTVRLTADSGAVTGAYAENQTTGSKIGIGDLASGEYVDIDTSTFVATSSTNGDVTGKVDRTGSTTTDWFQLRPNVDNVLATNAGTLTVTYTKAFM